MSSAIPIRFCMCSNFFAMYYANQNLLLAHSISKLFKATSNLFETNHNFLIKNSSINLNNKFYTQF